MIEKVADRWVKKNASSKPIYAGVFLSPSAQKELLQRIPAKFSQVFAHHITFWFKSDGPMPDLPFGEEVKFRVVEFAEDDKGQAVAVDLPPPYYSSRRPHITISTDKGVSPVYSNTLIQHGLSPLPNKFYLTGTIGWWDGQKARFDPIV